MGVIRLALIACGPQNITKRNNIRTVLSVSYNVRLQHI